MFRAALFLTAKKWRQPKCPLINEQRNKMWSIHAMEYDSFIKRNVLLLSCYNMDDPLKPMVNDCIYKKCPD